MAAWQTIVVLLAGQVDTESPAVARLRFPPQWVCQSSLRFNRDYADHCRKQIAGALNENAASHWRACLAEVDQLHSAWICVTLLPGERNTCETWARWLPRLKELIGEEAYAAGEMPPPVPLWRFHYAR